jgi:glycerol-3-phosphate dehydrogenase (NAD(P)+)
MKICYLGAGSWGFCLANLLATKGYIVVNWTTNRSLVKELNAHRRHPRFPNCAIPQNLTLTDDLSEALDGADMVVESVTSAGVRPVFNDVKLIGLPKCPIVLTSKGIERNTGLILPNVVLEIFGDDTKEMIALLSGPSFADDVVHGLPTSVVGTAFSQEVMWQICDVFSTKTFRVYPNSDIYGVAYGGALKNIIAIACGISDGLGLGASARAALMTRGLHEMRKLAEACGCEPHTLNGLSGLGDLVLTCSSTLSRNYSYGKRIGLGESPADAKREIAMAIEGEYTCQSAFQIGQKLGIEMPITGLVYGIISGKVGVSVAVNLLMQRSIKEEHL